MRTPQTGSEIFPRLNDLPLSRSERELGNAYIHEGELIGDFLCRALESIRSAVGHGTGDETPAATSISAKPVKH